MDFRAVICIAMLQGVAAQTQAPYLTPSSVVPAMPSEKRPLQAGMLVSIYGRNLGPDRGCTAEPHSHDEATELCGTVVMVDGEKASLLYVQERQINLRVPPSVSGERDLQFVVTYDGRSGSAIVQSRHDVQTASRAVEVGRISLIGSAYVHMPIWIAVSLPGPHQRSVRYPITVYPADFGGHDFEVRRNGLELPKIKTAATMPKAIVGPMSVGGIGGGSLLGLPHEPRQTGRLPLHLMFRFDVPGQYQVRYSGYGSGGIPFVRSDWLTIQVEPYPEQKRLTWLEDLKHSAPTDSVDLLTEYLPSLLAQPDTKALNVLERYLYRPDELVRNYTLYALYLFEDADLVRWMLDVLHRLGPTPEVAYFLSWRADLFKPRAGQLLQYVSEHARSESPLILGGVLQALVFMKQYDNVKSSPASLAKIDALVMERAESIFSQPSRDVLQPLALYLGGVKTDKSRLLLWRLVEQGIVREQALICLTWIADRRDLPRLATYLDQHNLEYHLKRAYGQSAQVYIDRKRR